MLYPTQCLIMSYPFLVNGGSITQQLVVPPDQDMTGASAVHAAVGVSGHVSFTTSKLTGA